MTHGRLVRVPAEKRGSLARDFEIVVTVKAPSGVEVLAIQVAALDIVAAKREALAHCARIGYEGATLGFPKRTKGRK